MRVGVDVCVSIALRYGGVAPWTMQTIRTYTQTPPRTRQHPVKTRQGETTTAGAATESFPRFAEKLLEHNTQTQACIAFADYCTVICVQVYFNRGYMLLSICILYSDNLLQNAQVKSSLARAAR